MTREEAIQIIRDIYHTDEEMTALEVLIPELRESDDERIRKAIVHLLEVASEAYLIEATGFKKEQFLSYLEKQKINTEGDFGRGYDCGYQAGYAVAMNEMKPKVATATLDSEKPMNQDELEKEIDKRYLQTRVVGYQDGVGEILLGREAFERIARHFAKWGAEHLKK